MLVREVNDDADGVARTADFVAEIAPQAAYLAIPTRPPVVQGVAPPSASRFLEAYEVFRERFANAQCLVEYEGDEFTSVGSAETAPLSS